MVHVLLILYFTTMTILSTESLQSKNQFTSISLSWNVLSCSSHASLHSAFPVSVQPLCKAHSDSWLSSFPWSPQILSVCSTSFNNQVWAFACSLRVLFSQWDYDWPQWREHFLYSWLDIHLGMYINNLRYADDTTLMAESEEELKNLLMKVKEESEKVGLKLNIQKIKIMASGSITSWQVDGGNNGNSERLYFLVLQNHCRWLQPWN